MRTTAASRGDQVNRIAHLALKRGKSVDDVVLSVVREAFKETSAIRFEGNNYSDEWVKEAEKRGLPNLRRSPEALDQLLTRQSREPLGLLVGQIDARLAHDASVGHDVGHSAPGRMS